MPTEDEPESTRQPPPETPPNTARAFWQRYINSGEIYGQFFEANTNPRQWSWTLDTAVQPGDFPTNVNIPIVKRQKTLFCVISKDHGFAIKGYHSLKSAKRHEPDGSYVNYATQGDLSRAKFAKKVIPQGVIYSKLGEAATEHVPRTTSRGRRATRRPQNPPERYLTIDEATIAVNPGILDL